MEKTTYTMRQIATLVLSAILMSGLLSACAATGDRRSTGQAIDDASIASRTNTALLRDETTAGTDIDVEVDRARVQLNGFVDTDAQRVRAGEIAESIEGVVSVENNLRVSGGPRTTGEYVDDNVLFAKVNTALARDPVAKALDIDVEVNRGVVSLGGFVNTSAEASAAVEAAKMVYGVKRVINNIEVR